MTICHKNYTNLPKISSNLHSYRFQLFQLNIVLIFSHLLFFANVKILIFYLCLIHFLMCLYLSVFHILKLTQKLSLKLLTVNIPVLFIYGGLESFKKVSRIYFLLSLKHSVNSCRTPQALSCWLTFSKCSMVCSGNEWNITNILYFIVKFDCNKIPNNRASFN